MRRREVASLPVSAQRGELWSLCGERFHNAASARWHAMTHCSVGRVVN